MNYARFDSGLSLPVFVVVPSCLAAKFDVERLDTIRIHLDTRFPPAVWRRTGSGCIPGISKIATTAQSPVEAAARPHWQRAMQREKIATRSFCWSPLSAVSAPNLARFAGSLFSIHYSEIDKILTLFRHACIILKTLGNDFFTNVPEVWLSVLKSRESVFLWKFHDFFSALR